VKRKKKTAHRHPPRRGRSLRPRLRRFCGFVTGVLGLEVVVVEIVADRPLPIVDLRARLVYKGNSEVELELVWNRISGGRSHCGGLKELFAFVVKGGALIIPFDTSQAHGILRSPKAQRISYKGLIWDF
jgi:hypothetical protein